MIDIQGLNFGYKHNKNLFQNLNLTMSSGQIHGLLGLNGAGKSSLLHLIQGLRYSDQGDISVFGNDPSRRRVQFLQDVYLIAEEIFVPEISLKSFIERYSPYYPSFSLESFLKFLNEFELSQSAHLGKLSMGQRKKAIIAFGLATNTQVLMMDEPTNGLDIPSKKQFRKILSHIITEDRLFLISTHQIRDLHSLIDNVIVINNGKIIFDHSIQKICDTLHFSLLPRPDDDASLIYHERVPGGYLNIKPTDGSDSFEPDLEVLFNAIITDATSISEVFQTDIV